MDPEVLVSIVIPVKNGDAWLKDVMPAIFNQELDGEIELIAIDSGSTDNTLSILAEYPVKLIHIRPEEFNHGLTRNQGVALAKGKFVVLTVQDAKPASNHWLATLLEGFTDETVAGVCGQQIVPHHTDKNPVDWYRPISAPEMRKISFADPSDFNELAPDKQLAFCRWDNVNAIYRRDVLLKLPFRRTDFAEDAVWAKDALQTGYSLVYHPSAQVEHYHRENFDYAFKRNFSIHYHFYKFFRYKPEVKKQNIVRVLKIIKLLMLQKGLTMADRYKWFKYSIQNQQGVISSNALFLESVAISDQKLDETYHKVCQSVPQALKS